MLYHSLLSGSTGDYFQQLVATLVGNLDAPAFQASWQAILDRHPALRTGFRSLASGEALQVVEERMELPWVYEDWWEGKDADCSPDESDLEEALERLLASDRARGFDYTEPPSCA